ncbi:protein-methionine-sulfoxide reductase catalytic subunit MsrP [Minwuia thermotolerans]|uniref:Protein-methionine-sulfoxide reductase catalytic subunit MsrP n=1 Tax=Minwuia thermotolerans TaxID=2056226 RepID=A0A2M9FYM3_9PROT|nr:protein-methionine-sulfoxide reductase catalytic subunit MsrP [Minwuia thermotolerans]PJK28563.1 protein-methionine-sulfoxide reductase catalytic subunit MsrP [Minwuia thermotolerans]
MLIRKRRGWEIPESQVTPEHVFLNRRQILKAAGFGAAGILASRGIGPARADEETIPTADLYPAARNDAYTVERAITDKDINFTYNNFYEFGSHKRIYRDAQDLEIRPWTVEIAGMVDNPKTWDIDDLVRTMGVEERVYRHRCVEAWSMVAPWAGFPLAKLVAAAGPKPDAKYVVFKTFMDPDTARGQRQSWYPWPYIEAMTVAEAMNEMPFLVTGVYGQPLVKQMGAPIRLALPWKYGFKSIKSIVSIEFTDTRPKTFWEEIQPAEYGFWANVNPEVDHPRWSQATEEVLGTDGRVPTQLFNGYGEQVAHLYKDMDQSARSLWM